MTKKVKNAENLDTLPERLAFLLDKAGMTYSHLAEKLEKSPQDLYQFKKNLPKKSKYPRQIAEILNANQTWLETGEGEPFNINNTDYQTDSDITRIPIFVSEQLKNISNITDLQELTPVDNFISKRIQQNNTLIAFYLRDNSFSPRFEKGDLVIIEITKEIKTGSLGLVYSKKKNDIIFCYFIHLQKQELLIGFVPNDEISAFIIEPQDIVFGIAKESIKLVNI